MAESSSLLETVAAIAMGMGESKRRQAAYDAASDSMGGFPGFYQAAIEMATSLERYAADRKIVWGEHADWILTTDNVAEGLISFMARKARLPDEKERERIIKGYITS